MIPTRDRYESVYYYWPYATQDKLSSLVLGGGKWELAHATWSAGHVGVMCTARADDHGHGLKSATKSN